MAHLYTIPLINHSILNRDKLRCTLTNHEFCTTPEYILPLPDTISWYFSFLWNGTNTNTRFALIQDENYVMNVCPCGQYFRILFKLGTQFSRSGTWESSFYGICDPCGIVKYFIVRDKFSLTIVWITSKNTAFALSDNMINLNINSDLTRLSKDIIDVCAIVKDPLSIPSNILRKTFSNRGIDDAHFEQATWLYFNHEQVTVLKKFEWEKELYPNDGNIFYYGKSASTKGAYDPVKRQTITNPALVQDTIYSSELPAVHTRHIRKYGNIELVNMPGIPASNNPVPQFKQTMEKPKNWFGEKYFEESLSIIKSIDNSVAQLNSEYGHNMQHCSQNLYLKNN